MDKRKYIPMFLDWPEVTCALSWEEKGRLVEAMALYARGDDWEACLVGNERFLFPALRGAIDRMAALSRKRSAAGRRGGMKSARSDDVDDGDIEQGYACDVSDATADDGAPERGCVSGVSDATADDGDLEQDWVCVKYDSSADDCFQAETDSCKAKQSEAGCAERGYNNNNKYNNENEEPMGERLRAQARRSPARQAVSMNHMGHTEQLQHLQQVQHMLPTSTSTSTSTSSSTSASALSSASTAIARTRGNAPPTVSC